jgi:hypothetical protein
MFRFTSISRNKILSSNEPGNRHGIRHLAILCALALALLPAASAQISGAASPQAGWWSPIPSPSIQASWWSPIQAPWWG